MLIVAKIYKLINFYLIIAKAILNIALKLSLICALVINLTLDITKNAQVNTKETYLNLMLTISNKLFAFFVRVNRALYS